MSARLFLRCSECHQIRLCDDPGDSAEAICDPCWDEQMVEVDLVFALPTENRTIHRGRIVRRSTHSDEGTERG